VCVCVCVLLFQLSANLLSAEFADCSKLGA